MQVRGHSAKLFEAHRSEGANIDFRVVYWKVPSQREPGAQIQYSISVHPTLYTEEETIILIDRLVAVS